MPVLPRAPNTASSPGGRHLTPSTDCVTELDEDCGCLPNGRCADNFSGLGIASSLPSHVAGDVFTLGPGAGVEQRNQGVAAAHNSVEVLPAPASQRSSVGCRRYWVGDDPILRVRPAPANGTLSRRMDSSRAIRARLGEGSPEA